MPSPAEALAVLSGCTLLQSAQDGPFNTKWNSSIILDPPETQHFNASVLAQQYGSGVNQPYQRGFYIVLITVFLVNVFVLGYWCWRREWYNDFSDPANLFSLAINSPPSEKLAGCYCGGNPDRGEQFKHPWKLGRDGGHVYMESPDLSDTQMEESPGLRRSALSDRFEGVTRPISMVTNRWSRHNS